MNAESDRELVLRAASLMRERAERATNSTMSETWTAEGPNWQVLADGTPIFDCSACAYGPNASGRPDVARRVASLLEYFGRFWPDQGIEERLSAVAMARSFLREES